MRQQGPRDLEIKASNYQRQFLHYALVDPWAQIVAIGGARGPGKTWVEAMMIVLRAVMEGDLMHLMLRRVLTAAEANMKVAVEKALRQLDFPIGRTRYGKVQWDGTKSRFWFPNGSGIQLGYCKREDDYEQHMGIEYATVTFMEATQFPEEVWDRVGGSCRGGKNLKPLRTMDFNPGGRGHEWVKRRIYNEETRDPRVVWIPCKHKGSMPVLENDPGYGLRILARIRDETLRKRWEEGDMDVREGMFWTMRPEMFQEIEVPDWAEWYAGVDPGYYPGAYACVWVAKWKTYDGEPRIHVVADLKRQRLNLREQAEVSLQIEKTLPMSRPKVRWSDPAAWARANSDTDAGIVTAKSWAENGWIVAPAPKTSRSTGWLLMRTLLDDGIMTISPRCMSLLTEMQGAMCAPLSGDFATGCEDHVQDAIRYVLVATMGNYRKKPQRRVPLIIGGQYIPDRVMLTGEVFQ